MALGPRAASISVHNLSDDLSALVRSEVLDSKIYFSPPVLMLDRRTRQIDLFQFIREIIQLNHRKRGSGVCEESMQSGGEIGRQNRARIRVRWRGITAPFERAKQSLSL